MVFSSKLCKVEVAFLQLIHQFPPNTKYLNFTLVGMAVESREEAERPRHPACSSHMLAFNQHLLHSRCAGNYFAHFGQKQILLHLLKRNKKDETYSKGAYG